ncbi:MAG: hypothetical protein GAK35_01479 [Herbaspirillum frisingense]|uniref:Nuclear transport factor 2 family protein n=1 Tax=Herbaspirillum frisingense TaxID=92645 RepID=A0A7V8JV37_9BURK|nr:MAG: hypothetical protein GAK35_01479 [Herbaspirillum frisingense]
MSNANTHANTHAAIIAHSYLDTWNATDSLQRRALLESAWSEAPSYVDPMMSGSGREQIDGLIAAVQKRFPEWKSSLVGTPDLHGAYLRFSWSLGPEGVDGPVKGTDFVVLEEGRIKAVTGFLDQIPEHA